MTEINRFKVSKLPDSVYYLPNFITEDEEIDLLEKIYNAPKPKWKTLSNRRLQNWGGLPHPNGMIKEDLPEWMLNYMMKVSDLQVFGDKKPNHVLVNEYLPKQGIMPHEDGPLFHPVIATINLGSHTVLDYYEKLSDVENAGSETQNSRYFGSLCLERYSLLIVKDDMYTKFLHGIEERRGDLLGDNIKNLDATVFPLGITVERYTRISMTIRHVPKTVKSEFIFGIR